jgi:ArsR family transcriptional regulator
MLECLKLCGGRSGKTGKKATIRGTDPSSIASKKKLIDLQNSFGEYAKYTMDLESARLSAKQRSSIVKAMAHPTRLLVVEVLTQGEKCVNDLTLLAGCDVTTLSKHLALMRKAGLLQCEKRGVSVFYQIACPCFLEFFRCIDLIKLNQSLQQRCEAC